MHAGVIGWTESDAVRDSSMLCECRVSCLNVVCHRNCAESNGRKLKVPLDQSPAPISLLRQSCGKVA